MTDEPFWLATDTIQFLPTMFTDLTTGRTTYGFVAFDSRGRTYMDGWDVRPSGDLDWLRAATACADDVWTDMINSLLVARKGLKIGEIYYEFEKIEQILRETDRAA